MASLNGCLWEKLLHCYTIIAAVASICCVSNSRACIRPPCPHSRPRCKSQRNLLDRNFTPDQPNQKWAGDISYVWTREGWLYLAVILDLHSRRVIGWAVSNRMKRDLAIRALKMAVAFRAPPKGCIHHTDRGSQYCSHDYQKILRQHGFKTSMSGKGNCYDNAAVETFFKTIKAELIWRHSWETRRQAEMAIFEYINGFYNPRRRHSALGWKSPVAFERKVA